MSEHEHVAEQMYGWPCLRVSWVPLAVEPGTRLRFPSPHTPHMLSPLPPWPLSPTVLVFVVPALSAPLPVGPPWRLAGRWARGSATPRRPTRQPPSQPAHAASALASTSTQRCCPCPQLLCQGPPQRPTPTTGPPLQQQRRLGGRPRRRQGKGKEGTGSRRARRHGWQEEVRGGLATLTAGEGWRGCGACSCSSALARDGGRRAACWPAGISWVPRGGPGV